MEFTPPYLLGLGAKGPLGLVMGLLIHPAQGPLAQGSGPLGPYPIKACGPEMGVKWANIAYFGPFWAQNSCF